ncbi:unnamed protein product, partial [Adineta steineri]
STSSYGNTMTVYATDIGLWEDCKLGDTINVNVKYFLDLTLSQANCHQGNFTTLSMIGNFVILFGLPQKIFNFTIKLGDPTTLRQLDIPQEFFGYVTLPIGSGVDVPPNGNFTYKFPETDHGCDCDEVPYDEVYVDADLNVADLIAPIPT